MPAVKPAVVFSICVLALSCVGCRSVNENNIVGAYHASVPCVSISLVVNADHSFEQTLTNDQGTTHVVRGTWRLGTKPNEHSSMVARLFGTKGEPITLEPFLDLIHTPEGEKVGGAVLMVEILGPSTSMGPVIVGCPGSSYEINYAK